MDVLLDSSEIELSVWRRSQRGTKRGGGAGVSSLHHDSQPMDGDGEHVRGGSWSNTRRQGGDYMVPAGFGGTKKKVRRK